MYTKIYYYIFGRLKLEREQFSDERHRERTDASKTEKCAHDEMRRRVKGQPGKVLTENEVSSMSHKNLTHCLPL